MPSFHPTSDQLQTHHLPRHAPWGFFSQFQCKCCADSLLGRWAAALLGVQLHEPFPQQQRQFTSFAPTFGHLLLALHHALYCTLDCAETALCGDVRWAKIETTTKKTQKTRKLSYPKVGFLTQFTGQSHHQLGLFISTIEQEEIWGMGMGLRWGWRGGSGNFSNLTFPWRKWLCNCRWWLCCTRLMHPEGLSWCSSGKRMQLPLHWAQDVSVSKGRL